MIGDTEPLLDHVERYVARTSTALEDLRTAINSDDDDKQAAHEALDLLEEGVELLKAAVVAAGGDEIDSA